MSGLKKMAGTDRFLAKDDIVKNCSLQSYEDCHTEAFLERAEIKCGCLPWSFSLALPRPPPNSCSPAALPCYTQVAEEDFGCRDSCTGLYADVEYIKDTSYFDYGHIVKEYHSYKASFARNIQFDGDQASFGKSLK